MGLGLNSIHRRLRTQVANLQEVRQEAYPYLTRFTCPQPSLPPPPKVEDYPGLLFFKYAEPHGGDTEISAYWRSRDAARASAGAFARAFGTESPVFEGYLRHIEERPQPWWKKLPVGQWILYAASLFGALVAIQTYFAKLFEAPDVTLEVPGQVELDVLASDALSFAVTLGNRSREVPVVTTLAAPRIVTVAGKPLEQKVTIPLNPPPIQPAASFTLQAKGDPLPPGRYNLVLAAKARSGYFRGPLPVETALPLRVWNLEPEAHIDSITVDAARRPWLRGRVLVGTEAPRGLGCQLTLQGFPEVGFGFVDFPGVEEWQELPAGITGSSLAFKTSRSFGGFHEIDLQISLLNEGAGVAWDAVAKDASLACEKLEEAQP